MTPPPPEKQKRSNSRTLKLVTQTASDNEAVVECLTDAVDTAVKIKATDVFIVMRGSDDAESFTGYWTENNRVIGMLESAKFDMLCDQFGVFDTE